MCTTTKDKRLTEARDEDYLLGALNAPQDVIPTTTRSGLTNDRKESVILPNCVEA